MLHTAEGRRPTRSHRVINSYVKDHLQFVCGWSASALIGPQRHAAAIIRNGRHNKDICERWLPYLVRLQATQAKDSRCIVRVSPHGETSLWFRVQRYDNTDCHFDHSPRFLLFSVILTFSPIGGIVGQVRQVGPFGLFRRGRTSRCGSSFFVPETECKDTTRRKPTFSFVQFASGSFRIIQFISVSFSLLHSLTIVVPRYLLGLLATAKIRQHGLPF